MSKPLVTLAVALAAGLFAFVSLAPKPASADACAAPANVTVAFKPTTDCVDVTHVPECNGDVSITFTNHCTSDLIGIEHRSSVQVIPADSPPLTACLEPWEDAKSAGMEPPPCVLKPEESGMGRAQATDELAFELEGALITAHVTRVEAANESDGGGCSTSGRSSGRSFLLMALAAGLAAARLRRTRRHGG